MPVPKKTPRGSGNPIIVERAGVVPVRKVKRAVFGPASEEEHDPQDDKAEDRDQLDAREPELSFTEERHGDDIQEQYNDQHDGDPDSDADGRFPVINDNGRRRGFGRDQHGIRIPVVPTVGKGETRINETFDEVWDGDAFHREVCDDLGQDAHDVPDHHHHG